jgi:hypothetical protein
VEVHSFGINLLSPYVNLFG